MSKSLNFLQTFDMFPKNVALRIGGLQNHKSLLGLFGSAMAFAVVVFSVIIYGQELVARKSPIVVYTNAKLDIPKMLPFGASNFPIAFGMQNFTTQQHYIDQQIYNVYLVFKKSSRVKQPDGTEVTQFTTNYRVKAEKCDIAKHFKKTGSQEFAASLDLNRLYCVPGQPAYNQFGGDLIKTSLSTIHLEIFECDETVEQKCQNKEIREKALNAQYFNFYYFDLSVDPRSSSPLQQTGKNYLTSVSNKFFQQIDFRFQDVTVDVDIGISFNQIVQYQGSSLSDVKDNYFGSQGNLMLQIGIFSAFDQDMYSISYQKLQGTVAEIMGTVQMFLITLLVVISPFIQADYNMTLINQVFRGQVLPIDQNNSAAGSKDLLKQDNSDNFSGLNNPPENKIFTANSNRAKILPESSAATPNTQSFITNSHSKKSQNDLKEGSDIQSELNQKRSQIQLENHQIEQGVTPQLNSQQSNQQLQIKHQINNSDYMVSELIQENPMFSLVKSVFGNQKAKEEYAKYNKAKEIVYDEIDILNIQKRMRQVEMIKHLMFQKEQYDLLELIDRIHWDEKTGQFSLFGVPKEPQALRNRQDIQDQVFEALKFDQLLYFKENREKYYSLFDPEIQNELRILAQTEAL